MPESVEEVTKLAWRSPDTPGLRQRLQALAEAHRHEPSDLARIRLCQGHVEATQRQDFEEALQWIDRGVSLGEQAVDPVTWLRLVNYVGYLMLLRGQFAEAVEPLVAALRGGIHHGIPESAGTAGVNLAETMLILGDPSAALRTLERVDFLDRTSDLERAWVRVRALAALGRPEDARNACDAVAQHELTQEREVQVLAAVKAQVALLEGRCAGAVEHVVLALGAGGTLLSVGEQLHVLDVAAQAELRAGNLESAWHWAQQALTILPHHRAAYEIQMLRTASQIAMQRGEVEEAFGLLERAVASHAEQQRRHVSRSILSFAERHLAEIERRDVDLATVNEALRRSRKAAEEARENVEAAWARLQIITDSVPLQVCHLNPDGVVQFANAAMVRAWAAMGCDVLGADLPELLEQHDRRGCLAGFASAAAGTAYTSVEGVPLATGERQLEASWVPAGPADAGVYLFVRDVTDRAEQAQLERQLQDSQRLESLGVLASGIAHDFNNLLTGLTANIEVVLDRIHDPFATEALQDALAAANQAADLTRQLFAFTGMSRMKSEVVHLNELARSTADIAGAGIDKRGVLHVELADQPLTVTGESAQLAQLCLNLVVNASESLERGHGSVWIRTGRLEHDGQPLAGAHPDPELPEGPYCWFEVQDTGVGIDSTLVKRVFEPFFTTKGTGRGLGLAACLGIVRGHQGRVLLGSEPGRGTTIRVLLPFVDEATQSGPLEPLEGTEDCGPVLVVDDNSYVRRALKRILTAGGWHVHLACDGREGLQRLREVRPHVVFLDLLMPVMDGAQTLAAIRATSDVPVVLMSGYTESEASTLLGPDGAQGFLQKPLAPRAVLDVARQVAANARR